MLKTVRYTCINGFKSIKRVYIPIGLQESKADRYEKELKRVVNQFKNIAEVWSIFEIRINSDIETISRGLNSIQLYFERADGL